ncbi:MAG: hypothetical protein RLZZ584_4133 [Pseudomonadota bacterium]
MPNYDTHLCLVSAQATPNLLPVLDERWRPRHVVLATSPRMRAAAAALQHVIRGKGLGISTELLELPDAYAYDALCDTFLNYLAGQGDKVVALNVTGGTKLMAVAAQEVFRGSDQPVLYVNVETDEVIVVGRSGHSEPLRAKLKVRELLESHGYTVEHLQQPQIPAEQRDLCTRVVDHVGSAGRALGQLNLLAAQARTDAQLKARLTDQQLDSRTLGDMLALFADAGQLHWQGQIVQFASESARTFVNGGWLETHVYGVLQNLRGGGDDDQRITDVALNLRATHPDGKTRNEIDVAFLYRNTLHLIECKTANLAQDGSSGDDKATEAIYKMEALLKLGGLRTRGMIVDYRGALSAHKANLDRARNAGIEVVAGTHLRDLRGAISRAWLST